MYCRKAINKLCSIKNQEVMIKTLGVRAEFLTLRQLKRLKKHSQNRKIDRKQVNKILAALERGEAITPIMFNRRTMVLVDGHHRIEAIIQYIEKHPEAKKVIFECVSIDIPESNEFPYIITCNSTAKSWKNTDYLNAFSNKGNENYIRLRDFATECNLCHDKNGNLKIVNAISLLGRSTYHTLQFKNEEFEVTLDEIHSAKMRARQINAIVEALDVRKEICTRSIYYLIQSWVGFEKKYKNITSDERVSYIITNKKYLKALINREGNKLQKTSDWNHLFLYVDNELNASPERCYERKLVG